MTSLFSSVLLAYDESAGSQMALRYACAVARTGAKLSIANACGKTNFVASATVAGGFPPIDASQMIRAVDENADTILQGAVRKCALHGVAAAKIFVHDTPAEGVVAAAHDEHATLIVVGTRGRKGLVRAALGSVAERILRASDVPVLVLNRHMKPPRLGKAFTRALVAVDGSDTANAALSMAGNLAVSLGVRLTLCTVKGADGVPAGEDVAGADALEAALFLIKRAEATKDVGAYLDDEVVVEGDVASQIEHVAMQRNCDLIIVGSHKRRGLRRLLEGSTAETVARSSALPVLVVPAEYPAG